MNAHASGNVNEEHNSTDKTSEVATATAQAVAAQLAPLIAALKPIDRGDVRQSSQHFSSVSRLSAVLVIAVLEQYRYACAGLYRRFATDVAQSCYY